MIQLDHVTHRYASPHGDDVCALDDVSLTVDKGRFTALKGPSGCGKSSLLLITGGLLRPTAGKVTIDESEPYALPPDERARFRAGQIGFVFQQFHLVPYLDVLDNVMAASIASGRKNSRWARQLVEQFGLQDRVHHTPAKLSTGEKQRTAMARALYNEPRMLLADEPTGNLDEENARIVLENLAAFAAGGGTVLMVSHDTHAAGFAHEIKRMKDGKLFNA